MACNSRRFTRAAGTFLPSQANNLYIFPAVGMAIYATNAKRATDEMFIEAAHAVADQVTSDQLKLGMLSSRRSRTSWRSRFGPPRGSPGSSSNAGLARVARPADIEEFIRRHPYKPEYGALA